MTAEARREVIERAATEVFAERGYHAASVDEIAERSGISIPVLYDHFESKVELHRRLLERHFAEMRASWRDPLRAGDSREERISRAIDAWFAYVQSHPYAWRMLFRDTTGNPEIERIHREAAEQSRALLLPVLAREPGVEYVAGPTAQDLEMAWEGLRSLLQGLALWWHDHQHIPRARMVATAMNITWIGFERVGQGETWNPPCPADDAGAS